MEQNILIETLEKRIKTLEEQNQKLKRENEHLEEEIDDLKRENDDLEEEIEELETDVDDLRDKNYIFTPKNLNEDRKIEIIKIVLNKYSTAELEVLFKDIL